MAGGRFILGYAALVNPKMVVHSISPGAAWPELGTHHVYEPLRFSTVTWNGFLRK